MAPKSSPASDSNVTNAFFEIAKLMTKKLEKNLHFFFFVFFYAWSSFGPIILSKSPV
jgi:hypothetical protein